MPVPGFSAEVLRRKLLAVDKKNARNRDKWERDAILAVCSLYGIDLLADNIAACRVRLLEIVSAAHTARFKTRNTEETARAVTSTEASRSWRRGMGQDRMGRAILTAACAKRTAGNRPGGLACGVGAA